MFSNAKQSISERKMKCEKRNQMSFQHTFHNVLKTFSKLLFFKSESAVFDLRDDLLNFVAQLIVNIYLFFNGSYV